MSARNTYYQDETVEKQKIDFKNLKRLLRYAAPYKRLFVLVLLLMLIAVASSLVTPCCFGISSIRSFQNFMTITRTLRSRSAVLCLQAPPRSV